MEPISNLSSSLQNWFRLDKNDWQNAIFIIDLQITICVSCHHLDYCIPQTFQELQKYGAYVVLSSPIKSYDFWSIQTPVRLILQISAVHLPPSYVVCLVRQSFPPQLHVPWEILLKQQGNKCMNGTKPTKVQGQLSGFSNVQDWTSSQRQGMVVSDKPCIICDLA